MNERLISLLNDYDDDKIQRDSGNSSNCSSSSSNCERHLFNDISYVFDDEEDEDDQQPVVGKRSETSVDFAMLNDERTLDNLVYLEDYYRIQANYFAYIQNEIKPWMRKTLATWMLEVCKNQSTDEDIFALAMNLLDRFLSIQSISKRHLQLLGTVCMFIAAKLKCSTNFNAETLVIYTANSISIEQLLNWEQFVLAKLKWDVNAITPFDFVPYLLNRLNIIEHKNIANIRAYLGSFISVCSTEFKFSFVPASMIAAGCLYLTIKYLNNLSKYQSELILCDIHKIFNCIDLECLVQCIEQIDELVRCELKLNLPVNGKSATEHMDIEADHPCQQQQLCEPSTC